jgi:hypothetical protein
MAVKRQQVGALMMSWHLDLDAHITKLLLSLYTAGTQSTRTSELPRTARSPSVSPKILRKIKSMSIAEQTRPPAAVSSPPLGGEWSLVWLYFSGRTCASGPG